MVTLHPNELLEEFGVSLEVMEIGKELYVSEATIPKKPYGIFLGDTKPAPALVNFLGREHTVTVNDKASWLFLCGRDILNESIVEKGKATPRGFYVVVNEHGESIGVGRATPEGVKNVLDKGAYLRMERGRG